MQEDHHFYTSLLPILQKILKAPILFSLLAFDASPNSKSTSVGRKYLGSTFIKTFLVLESIPTSSIPLPSKTSLYPNHLATLIQNSLTERVLPVAIT